MRIVIYIYSHCGSGSDNDTGKMRWNILIYVLYTHIFSRCCCSILFEKCEQLNYINTQCSICTCGGKVAWQIVWIRCRRKLKLKFNRNNKIHKFYDEIINCFTIQNVRSERNSETVNISRARHFICHQVHFHKILYCCSLIDICILNWLEFPYDWQVSASVHIWYGILFCSIALVYFAHYRLYFVELSPRFIPPITVFA